MARTAAEMVAEARARAPLIAPEDAAALPGVVFLDVRELAEVAASGKVRGAVHVPRGMLEFKADPTAPTHLKALDPAKTVVTYCAAGGRAALAAALLKDLGFEDVRHMGGFKDWADKGLPTEGGN